MGFLETKFRKIKTRKEITPAIFSFGKGNGFCFLNLISYISLVFSFFIRCLFKVLCGNKLKQNSLKLVVTLTENYYVHLGIFLGIFSLNTNVILRQWLNVKLWKKQGVWVKAGPGNISKERFSCTAGKGLRYTAWSGTLSCNIIWCII